MSTYATPIPGAPGYGQAALLAKTAFDNATARFNRQRADLLLKNGYQRGADGSLSVDPNNQYGGFQQMLRGEAGASDQAQNAQRASGWGNSGFAARPEEALRYGQGAEQANFGTALVGDLAGIDEGQNQAAFDRDQALYNAELDASRTAINDQNFNPADYSGITPPAYGQTPVAPPTLKTAKPSSKSKLVKQVVQRRAKPVARRR